MSEIVHWQTVRQRNVVRIWWREIHTRGTRGDPEGMYVWCLTFLSLFLYIITHPSLLLWHKWPNIFCIFSDHTVSSISLYVWYILFHSLTLSLSLSPSLIKNLAKFHRLLWPKRSHTLWLLSHLLCLINTLSRLIPFLYRPKSPPFLWSYYFVFLPFWPCCVWPIHSLASFHFSVPSFFGHTCSGGIPPLAMPFILIYYFVTIIIDAVAVKNAV